MQENPEAFHKNRTAALARILSFIEAQQAALPVSLVARAGEISAEEAKVSARREVLSLFHDGIAHLQNGAPGAEPGSMAQALSLASLRRSALASSLGVPPPQFEQMFFTVDFSNGREAAQFFCLRLMEAAESDLPKSRQAIQQHILMNKEASEVLKRQMGLSLNVLVEVYGDVASVLKKEMV